MATEVALLIGAAVGILVGFALGWFYRRGQGSAADDRLANELRQQLAQREGDLAKVREQLTRTSETTAEAKAKQEAAESLLKDQRMLHERALAEARAAQEKALADLREAFRALSAEALKQTAPEFLRLAEQSFGKFQETAKGDLAQRQEAIKTLVEPLKQQLDTYQQRLQQAEATQAGTLGEVKRQLETLSQYSHALEQETHQFRAVLRSNPARGRWGEETLRRVVESAGMSPHCDFSEQTKEGDSQPDLVVRLPGERLIIVDAKVPDLDFLSVLEGADATRRAESLAAHAAKLKATIRALAERDYPSQFPNALDYVVLFLPSESLFSAALEGDRELIVWAAQKRILLTTPASLIALLRSVSVSWQQHAQTVNAQKIAEAAQELYARVVKFTEHFDKIRAGLGRANEAFNEAAASFQTRVRPAGERLAELGGGAPNRQLADVKPLDSALRSP